MAENNLTVNIKGGRLFPFPFLLLGAVFCIAGFPLLTTSPLFAGISLLAGASILTAHEGTEINPSTRTFREYNSFLFLKRGRNKKYSAIEKIFVNSGKVSQRIYTAHTMNSGIFTNMEYNAFLKFEDGVKVFLVSHKNKNRLLLKLNKIGRALNVPVVDNTTRNM